MLMINSGNEQLNYFATFLFGGLFVTLIYILATKFNDPVLAAIIGFFPLGLQCCFVMPTKNDLKKYMYNGLYVCFLTLLVIFIGYIILIKTDYYPIGILIFVIILWFILQYMYYANKKLFGV